MQNSPYKKGVENVPLQNIVTTQLALVIVYNLLDNDEVVVERKIDYGKYEDRKWLGRITHWALSNHHSIETIALIDAEAPMQEGK